MKRLAGAILLLLTPAAFGEEIRTIKVTAQSEIKVAPDEVLLELAVHTRDKTLVDAKLDNDKITAAVLALAPRHEVPADDVKVTTLHVSPDRGSYQNRHVAPIAYGFTRSIQIRLTDFSKIEPFLADAFEAGLSHINSLHFRVGNQREHQFEARKLAVTYAREKAEHLTELTGMKLGLPVRIEQDIQYNWDASGFGGAIGALNPATNGARIASSKPPIVFATFQELQEQETTKNLLTAPGHIIIEADVMIEFEMSPK